MSSVEKNTVLSITGVKLGSFRKNSHGGGIRDQLPLGIESWMDRRVGLS